MSNSAPSKPGTPRVRVSPARLAAHSILLRVQTQQSYASELLHSDMTGRLDARDAGLCTELVMGCLRWQNYLDCAIQRFLKTPAAKLDSAVLVALRLGAYQLLRLSRIPARAAIAESVELVKHARKTSAAGLANAVLRRIAESGGPERLGAEEDPGELNPIALGHPEWLLTRWKMQIGAAQTLARAQSNNQPPVTYLRAAAGADTDSLARELESVGVKTERSVLLKTSLTLTSGNLATSEAFRRGDVVIQDQASQVIPLLLDVRAGQRVLDLCAAPGHKAALLANAAGTSGMVIAGDIHLHRLLDWTAPAHESAAAPLHRVVMDASCTLPVQGAFDRVLVDAPCSGTGTLRRNPEIKWRLTPPSLIELSDLQSKLLQQAASALAPKGRLVYSTCSLEPEENQQVVTSFLAAHPEWELVPLRAEAGRLAAYFVDSDGQAVRELLDGKYFQTGPEKQNTDGFFAAILQKRR